MKLFWVTCIFLVLFLTQDAASEKIKKHSRKYRKHHKATTEATNKIQQEVENSSNSAEKPISNLSNLEVPPEGENGFPVMDPCLKVHCGAGRICQLDNEGEPQCVCTPTCPEETDVRRKVCSNHNETWTSDCAVYQQRCLCQTNSEGCRGPNYKHVHIEYYGECREMPECTKEEMVDFPRRMRDWLFNIMRDLADRDELSAHYMEMEREAESNMTRRWTNAAIWKFCELDGNPADRSISIHELFPLKAPLMALEHCIVPFLNTCGADKNHRITMKEWAKCLELDEDEIEDRCEKISDE